MFKNYFILLLSTFCITGCLQKESSINPLSLGFERDKILVVNSNTTAPVSYTVTMYDEDGTFMSVIKDFTSIGAPIRGIAVKGVFEYILSLENLDRLDLLDLWGTTSVIGSDANFSGTIFDVEASPAGDMYVVETNTIERFSSIGVRTPAGATPYINTTIGACVLNTPRVIKFLSNGNLIVTNTGNDRVNVYSLTAGTASCISNNTTMGAVDPLAMLVHSDGNVYIGNNLPATSTIIRYNATATGALTTVFATNLALLSTPVAMAELSNGTMLIASDGTDAIITMNTSGSVLNPNFIRNSYTGSVTDIHVIRGQ